MTAQQPSIRIQEHFATLEDPRRGASTYPLMDIIVISVCAVICGADDFTSIARFGESKYEMFKKFLKLKHGIPSHDTFNKVLGALKPEEFEKCLLSWITALHEVTRGQVIALDGKTLRSSYDKANSKSAIHMVSAWATANHISLGQVVTDEKSNEITAIPKLLKLLDIHGAIVTIDAMGCQTKIAQAIVDGGGTYCLQVKNNQPTLRAAIQEYMHEQMDDNFDSVKSRHYETQEEGHGREEERWYTICPVPEDLADKERWPGIAAIGMVVSHTVREGRDCCDTRFYILSKYLSGKRFGEAVRNHWGIENSLHWQLDVTFGEDRCRVRKGHGDANLSILRRTALSLLKNEKTAKVGIKNKRLNAGWDDDYLLKVLTAT